jgi:violaxanthin de-epoxidase
MLSARQPALPLQMEADQTPVPHSARPGKRHSLFGLIGLVLIVVAVWGTLPRDSQPDSKSKPPHHVTAALAFGPGGFHVDKLPKLRATKTLPPTVNSQTPKDLGNEVRSSLAALLILGSTIAAPIIAPTQAVASDGAAIGKCLLKSCQLPLARCVTDPTCAANLVCIQTCAGKADESTCQIKCGDEFSNEVVAKFTDCAVSQKSCVPQRKDDGSYPVPKPEALVQAFDTKDFTGEWYISAGLNKAFDCFDCQLHKWSSPQPGKLVGDLQWRIKDPLAGSNFVTRKTTQNFVQDKKQPGVLFNGGNDFLHYEDTWYVLGSKKDEYLVVYYRGSNDAWDGYGGGTIYTKTKTLDKKYFAEINEVLKPIGYSMKDFSLNDNTCKARESRFEELENDLVFVETRVAGGLQSSNLVQEIEKDINGLQQEIKKDINVLEQDIGMSPLQRAQSNIKTKN